MASEVSVTEFARNLSDFINRVAYRGERFIIVRSSRAVGELTPVPSARRLGDLPAVLEGLPHLTDDDADNFARDVAKARSELAGEPIVDPWASS